MIATTTTGEHAASANSVPLCTPLCALSGGLYDWRAKGSDWHYATGSSMMMRIVCGGIPGTYAAV